jgi:hypothetical protein
MVALGGRLVLAVEHLGRKQERAAVDGRLIQVLAERDDSLVHDPDPGPLRPGRLVGCWIDEYGRLPGRQQPLQPALAEEVIGGDQHEQRLTLDLVLDCGQRRAVAVCPRSAYTTRIRSRPSSAGSAAAGSGVVADYHQDPLQPSGQQGPHGPFDQAQATEAEQDLGATPGDRCQPLGPACGQHHPHLWQPRRRRGGLDHVRPLGGRGHRIRRSLWCLSHAPTSRGATRVNAQGTVQGSPVAPAQARQARNG